MTVRLTSPVLGKNVGDSYTGSLESWLLNEGYATVATSVPDAWTNDNDGVLGAKAPSVTVTPTSAVLTGSSNAANLGANGNVVFTTKGGVRTTVALASGDTPAQAATKIDTALSGKADAAITNSKLVVTSVATGPDAYVQVDGGTATVLGNLGLSVGAVAHGGDGRPTGASNIGTQAALPANDPELPENREAPYWPLDDDLNATIANDGTNLTKDTFPAPKNLDFDPGNVDDDSPSGVVLTPNSILLAGGSVTATGSGYERVTGVTVGGTAATNVTVVDDTEVTFTAPAKTAGSYDVVFLDPSGNTTKTGGLTYHA